MDPISNLRNSHRFLRGFRATGHESPLRGTAGRGMVRFSLHLFSELGWQVTPEIVAATKVYGFGKLRTRADARRRLESIIQVNWDWSKGAD